MIPAFGIRAASSAAGVLAVLLPLAAVADPALIRIEIQALQTRTLSNRQVMLGETNGPPAVLGVDLRLPGGGGMPGAGSERLPAVILMHGSAGVGASVDRWANELNSIGVAALIVDSFTGRGLVSVGDDQSQLDHLAMLYDAYRALDLLAAHRRIDPSRIAAMGFSKGGIAVLYAAMERFQRAYAGPSRFAAFIPVYPSCQYHFIDELKVADRPIRIFHGEADDYVPIAACRDYVSRLAAAGKDARITGYTESYHAFDAHYLPVTLRLPNAQKIVRCRIEENPQGTFMNVDTGKPFARDDECAERGATVGYNAKAHAAVIEDVKAFLRETFRLK